MKATKCSPSRRSARRCSSLEPLELRIAPAAIFTYTDVDGDRVTIKTSKGTNAELDAIITRVAAGLGEQVQEIDFSANAAVFAKTDLAVTARRTALGGDGKANIGYVDATGSDDGATLDLGVVRIAGDLGRIRAGSGDADDLGVRSLSLQSLGQMGVFTQAPGGTLLSVILGGYGSLTVFGNIQHAELQLFGRCGPIFIGGSLIGGATADSGQISIANKIVSIKIGGSVLGGDGTGSGRIVGGDDIGSITIAGSLAGGDGAFSGNIFTPGAIGAVKIRGDVRGETSNSGQIAAGSLATLTIGGSLVGNGANSGEIRVEENIGAVKIRGDIRKTGTGAGGGIYSDHGMIGAVTLGGSLAGTVKLNAAGTTGTMGPITIRGDVDGGSISSNAALGNVTIGGSLLGDLTAPNSGEVRSDGNMGAVRIGGDFVGGNATASGFITSGGKLAQLFIRGSVFGGGGLITGKIQFSDGGGNITVAGNLVGGAGEESGLIEFNGNTTAVVVGGSVIGGSGNQSGAILTNGTIGSLKIGGDLRGGSVADTTLIDSGSIQAGRLPLVTIAGSIVSGELSGAGNLQNSGAIRVSNDIGRLAVLGDIIGNESRTVEITASGQPIPAAGKNLAIGSILVKGRVERANILAGYSRAGAPVDADAQIGRVTAGNWIASNLIAGLTTGSDTFFGDNNDTVAPGLDSPDIVSRIGRVVIRGTVHGTASPADGATFGFGAQEVVFFQVGKTVIPLTPGPGNNTFALAAAKPVGATRTIFGGVGDGFDVHIYEV